MTLLKFKAVLEEAGSPAARQAAACYAAIVERGISPAFVLGLFAHESRYATDPNSIVYKFNNYNPGNCRSSTIGSMPLISTDRGVFVKYPDWATGFRDLANRLIVKNYVYAQEGRRTIEQIITRFAPVKDGNDTAGYIVKVVELMNGWITPAGGGNSNMGVTLPNITQTPSPNYDQGPTRKTKIVIHDIEGSFDSGNNWIDSSKSGVSAHYIVSADGKRIDQSIRESDIAWHAGNYKYNQEAIGIEHEGYQSFSTGPYPDVMLRVSAALVSQICKRNGIAPNRQNIIGHGEVPPPNNHTDPGPKWPWDRYMAYVLNEYNGELNHVTTDNQGPNPVAFNPNPNNFAVGQGVIEAATRMRFEVLTAEQYLVPESGQAAGLTKRSMTWVKSEDGKIYLILAIQDQDKNNNPLTTWTTQVWLQTV
ncbi:MAG: N-acetylmuramoyl-L-alanine amidase [Taibaiella sp.]|nr:N-acetylmuramoyl-L-alanine amidase [Taibaiella sp.]